MWAYVGAAQFSGYRRQHDSFHRGPIPLNENLPDGYEEGMQFGMIGWYVPLSVYPGGLWRESQSAAAIGCARIAEVRFKSLEDLALDVVGRTVARVSGLASVRGRLSLPRGCTSR